MLIDQLDTLYKSYGSRNSLGVILGHRGQKVIFTKNVVYLKYQFCLGLKLIHKFQIEISSSLWVWTPGTKYGAVSWFFSELRVWVRVSPDGPGHPISSLVS